MADDSAEAWEARWREGVDRNISTLTANQQQTTVLLEGVTNRLKVLEDKPAETRQWFQTFTSGGGCLYMAVSLVVVVLFDLITIGVSVGLALAIR